jgi:hypothetical protein
VGKRGADRGSAWSGVRWAAGGLADHGTNGADFPGRVRVPALMSVLSAEQGQSPYGARFQPARLCFLAQSCAPGGAVQKVLTLDHGSARSEGRRRERGSCQEQGEASGVQGLQDASAPCLQDAGVPQGLQDAGAPQSLQDASAPCLQDAGVPFREPRGLASNSLARSVVRESAGWQARECRCDLLLPGGRPSPGRRRRWPTGIALAGRRPATG